MTEDDKHIVDFLKKLYREDTKKKLCRCGNLQTHNLRWCSECGGEFTINASIPLCTIIEMQCTRNKYRSRDNGKNGYRWFEAMFRRSIGKGTIDLDRFEKLCKIAQEQINE